MKNGQLGKVQLCEYENKTLEAFVATRRSYDKFDCPVAHRNFSFLAPAHDCEIVWLIGKGAVVAKQNNHPST